jgi:hypothetical protein
MKTNTTPHPSESNVQTAPVSKGSLWAGRIMSAFAALFLLMDGGMKLFKPPVVIQATAVNPLACRLLKEAFYLIGK